MSKGGARRCGNLLGSRELVRKRFSRPMSSTLSASGVELRSSRAKEEVCRPAVFLPEFASLRSMGSPRYSLLPPRCMRTKARNQEGLRCGQRIFAFDGSSVSVERTGAPMHATQGAPRGEHAIVRGTHQRLQYRNREPSAPCCPCCISFGLLSRRILHGRSRGAPRGVRCGRRVGERGGSSRVRGTG